MAGPIASAVMLPEPQEPDLVQSPALSPDAHKRRQSSVSEQDAKRQRLNSNDANTDRRDSNAKPPAPPRKERGRERRLFGAALGALSQNSATATAAQKRRSEIEKRQQVQRKLEEEESEQRKLERKVRRTAQRKIEQKRFEKTSMRIRHDNLLSMAHFLQTESEPRLYYKPWATSAEEDDRIQYQINEANELIRRELDGYETRQDNFVERERPDSDVRRPKSGKEHDADALQQLPVANGGTNDSATLPKDPELREDHAEGLMNEAVSGAHAIEDTEDTIMPIHEPTADEASKDLMDENGEEVLEAAEDTVIY